jgi:hypothetical protein
MGGGAVARGERARIFRGFLKDAYLYRERLTILRQPGGANVFWKVDPTATIEMYMNSPGGSVTAACASTTRCRHQADIATICVGQAASMGAVLLAGRREGKRYALRTPA